VIGRVAAALALAALATPAAAAPLTLERALALVVARDERAAIADAEVAIGEAQVDRARAAFLPEVDATARYLYRGDPGTFQDRTSWDAALTGRVPLFDGRGIPLYRTATRERTARGHERREARRALRLAAAGEFLAALEAQAVLEAARHRVDFARATLADARGRADAQIASSNDVTRAELEVASAELAVRRADGASAAARLRLGGLLGIELDGPLAPPDALLADAAVVAAPADPARPDLAALSARAAAADQYAAEPTWRWSPSLDLIGAATASSVGGVTGKRSDWYVGLSAAWALWDGSRGPDRDERLAAARIAGLRLAQETRGVAIEERVALASLEAARGTSAAAAVAVAAARRNVDESRALYQQGLARALEVADASAGLFDAEVALARERVALGLAALAVRDARGLEPLPVAREARR
jgi:outer membrane protein TolC